MSNQIECRPLLIALAALSIGIGCKWQVPILILALPLLALARSMRSWTTVLTFLVVGYWISPPLLPVLVVPQYEAGPARILTEGEDRVGSVQSIAEINGLRILVSAPPGIHLHHGEEFGGPFIVAPVSEGQQPYDVEEGVQGKLKLKPAQPLVAPFSIFALSDRIKDDFRSFVEQAVSNDEAPWVQSLWLKGGNLPKADREQLALSGAYSLVSASGLNVFVLWVVLSWILGSLLLLDRRVQLALIALALAGYCLVSGFHEGTLRAGATCLVLSAAYLVRREPDLISVTALCGLVYLLLFPRALTSLGFQLSMLVPMALGFYLPGMRLSIRDETRNRVVLRMRQIATVTLIVFLSSEPLIAFHTGRFGFGTFVSGFTIGLAAPFAVGGVLIAYGLNWFLPAAAMGLMRLLVVPLAEGVKVVVSWIANVVPTFAVPSFTSAWLFVYFGLWLLVWREREVGA